MTVLILGIVVFLGVHSARIVAPDFRSSMIARYGEGGWKGLYSVAAAVGLILIVWGYGLARLDPVILWTSPAGLQHLALLLNLVAFVLLGFYLLPSGRLKARLGHPMVLSVKVWAFAHLLANGTLADLILFGSFLVWAIVDFASARRRQRAAGTILIAGPSRNDAMAILVGVLLWGFMVWRGHLWLIGVSPLA